MSDIDEGKTQYLPVKTVLTPELVKRLDAEAERQTMSRSLLIRRFCEQGLQLKNSQQEAAS